MANILKVYTAEQLFEMYKGKILSDNVGLTDFNQGSKTKALLESNSEIISSVSMDFKEAIYKAIPIALYQGFGFKQKDATVAIGSLRPYRKPAFWLSYTGSGTSAQITSTSAIIQSAVIGAPGDAFSFDYATYNSLTLLVNAIDTLPNWSATLVLDGSINPNTLFQYANKEVIGAANYLNGAGLDICLNSAIEILVPSGFSVTINQQSFITTENGTIIAGNSGVNIASQATLAGSQGNIESNAIDTLNGKGFINSSIDGVEQVINDSSFSNGGEAESANDRKVRFQQTVNALNAGTKSGILAAIRSVDGVRDAGMRTSFPFKGTNTIIVDDGTGSISSELLAAVEKVLYGDPNDLANFPGKNAEGIGYNIIAPTIVDVNIGISATRLATISVALDEIKNDIQTAVEQYVNTRSLGQNVLLSEIVRVAKNSNAAAYDVIVTSPVSNIVINDDEFAKTGAGTGGTVTVTVTISTTE